MEKRKPQEIIEVIFDVGYLLFALLAGVWLLAGAEGRPLVLLYGTLSLTLGLGDAFHLVPRILGQWTGTMAQRRPALGIGKLVTSVTMTAFYIMLFYVWQLYFELVPAPALTASVWLLASVRIALCLFPQNGWRRSKPPLSWAIIRNIPFFILGALIVFLFALTGRGTVFGMMPLAVTLSFVFYLVVVLFADKHKPLGAFMLPKTVMYIWMISMGFALL